MIEDSQLDSIFRSEEELMEEREEHNNTQKPDQVLNERTLADLDISEDHFLFDKKILKERLSYIYDLVKNQHDIYNKVVYIMRSGTEVIFMVNTGEVRLEIRVPLVNKSRMLDKEYVMEVRSLMNVVTSCGSTVIMRDTEGSPNISIFGGHIEFENYQIKKDKFQHILFDKSKDDLKKIEDTSMPFRFALMCKSMFLSSRLEDNKVLADGEGSYSNFISSVVSVKHVPVSFCLRGSDIQILWKLVKGSPVFYFGEFGQQYVVVGDWYKVIVTKTHAAGLESTRETIRQVVKQNLVDVNSDLFFRIISLLSKLVMHQSRVNINCDSGDLCLRAVSVTGKKFIIPIKKDISLPDVNFSCAIDTIKVVALLLKERDGFQFGRCGDRYIFENSEISIIF